jgi:hypothetical protein
MEENKETRAEQIKNSFAGLAKYVFMKKLPKSLLKKKFSISNWLFSL